ncbi:MAG: hypothetical protein ACTHXA_13920 [Gulosibacter sp.]|uniref:hypothetical protein n=1 Tax=Gulosibacter sp. TaxID=2817531 RepID=UPI003F91E72B
MSRQNDPDQNSENEPTKAFDYREFEDQQQSGEPDWQRATGSDTPTDEIEIPQDVSDRTRAMPASGQHDSGRSDSGRSDSYTAADSRTEEPTVALPKQEQRYEPMPGYEDVAATRPQAQSRQQVPSQYAQQPQYVQQPAFTPYQGDVTRNVSKGPSSGARVASVVINFFVTIGLVLAVWDYMGVQTMNSVIITAVREIPVPFAVVINSVSIVIGVLLLISGLTLALSGLGAAIFGALLALGSAVFLFVPMDWLGGGVNQFIGLSLPILIPIAFFMLAAGIGAHFARRSGAKKALRSMPRGV